MVRVAIDSAGVQQLLDDAPMSRRQILAVAIVATLSGIDGYDVVSISYAGPTLLEAWTLSKATLGAIFSSGLVGMAVGSLLLAPIADIKGRRFAILVGLLLIILGGTWSALAQSPVAMMASRVVDGFGLGLLIAVTTPMAAEFANKRRRTLAVAVTTMAYPLAGVIGGIAAAWLVRDLGWQFIFLIKTALALVLVPVVLRWLPESPLFLLSAARPGDLSELARYLRKCGHHVTDVEAKPVQRSERIYSELFAAGQGGITARLILVNALYAMVAFYIVSWLPQLIVDAGQTSSTANVISAFSRLAGVIGGVLLGYFTRWMRLEVLVPAAMVAAGLSMALFGFSPDELTVLTISAVVSGVFLFAGVSGLYAIIAVSFAENVRASGTGLVLGVGRISSAAAPLLAGWMFANGFERGAVSAVFAVLAIGAGLALVVPARTVNP
jgi:MFS family permease